MGLSYGSIHIITRRYALGNVFLDCPNLMQIIFQLAGIAQYGKFSRSDDSVAGATRKPRGSFTGQGKLRLMGVTLNLTVHRNHNRILVITPSKAVLNGGCGPM
jgi:hypothetical protein